MVSKIAIEIEIPECCKAFLEYIELNFGINIKEYLESIIKTEIHTVFYDFKKLALAK